VGGRGKVIYGVEKLVERGASAFVGFDDEEAVVGAEEFFGARGGRGVRGLRRRS